MAIPHVPLAIGLGGEGVVAQRALVGPVAVVRSQVANQRGLVDARVVAHVAGKRRAGGHAHVGAIVPLQRAQIREYRRAQSTGELALQLHSTKLHGERVLRLLLVTVGARSAGRAGRVQARVDLEIVVGRGGVRARKVAQYRARGHGYDALYVGEIFALLGLRHCVLVLQVQAGEEVVASAGVRVD